MPVTRGNLALGPTPNHERIAARSELQKDDAEPS